MGRLLDTVAPLLILGVVIFVFRAPLTILAYQGIQRVAPCTVPIPYTIGAIDPRFHISQDALVKDIEAAVGVWEKASGKDLFVYVASSSPALTISLQYDARQQTTQKLKVIGDVISSNTASYDALEAQYNAAHTSYVQKKSAYESEVATYQSAAQAYETEVHSWNARGGAPSSVVTSLKQKREQLQLQQSQLASDQQAVNSLADTVNGIGTRLNAMAQDLNIKAKTYNTIGAETGDEFEEGVFESSAGHEDITVYEYNSPLQLTRLLAHEFGHALGMDHVDGVSSIMYRLNQGASLTPSAADTAELNAVCRLNT